jgi:ferric-dicitrate binding protein FerR (iron transport regulator)
MSRFQTLLSAYKNDSISHEELAELFTLIDEDESLLQSALLEDLQQNSFAGLTNAAQREKMYAAILNQTGRRSLVYMWGRVAAAAVIILMFATGAYFVFNNKKQTHQIAQITVHDVPAPASSRAVITLANGQQIILDSVGNGTTLATQGNVKILKKEDGRIEYESAGAGNPAGAISYNTLSNPRGSRGISLILADGSKVWLNAASSLTYPTAFTGEERKVQISGEAYFEVAHNPDKPFHVLANGMDVEDIGTAFDINAYDDEGVIKTTLVQGEVKVAKGNKAQTLLPGQQSVLDPQGNLSLVKHADIESAIAWKNGLFSFDKADLKTVMRQVSRWYDLDVSYEGNIPPVQFSGEIGRDLSLNQLFSILNETRIHYRVEGKKMVVTP